LLVGTFALQAQVEPSDSGNFSLPQLRTNPSDSSALYPSDKQTASPSDSLEPDSVRQLSPDSIYLTQVQDEEEMLDYTVVYNAEDSIPTSLNQDLIELYNQATVEYGDIKIEAGYIRIEFDKNEVFAEGLPDSTGAMQQKPIFTERGKQYRADRMRYNFASQKAFIEKVITQEGDGFLHGARVKKTGDKVFYIEGGSFTTCSHEHPHYRIVTPKAKVISGEKVVTQFAYIEVVDIPTPLMIPFGFFPTTDKRKSGIILPSYGNSQFRGYFLSNGGFYWAASDYFDLTLTGDVYTQGGFGARALTNYKKRYGFSGSLTASYNLLRFGEEEFAEFIPGSFNNSSDFAVNWSHRQDPKANPSFNFSANVNVATAQFYKITSVDPNEILQNSLNSSVSFSKRWQNRPYRVNVTLNHSQNNQSQDLTLTLPNINFSADRFFPFKREDRVGSKRWYEEIGITYSADAKNEIRTKLNKPLFTETVFRDSSRMGLRHNLQVAANYKVLRYIVFNPNVNYTERWYPSKLEYDFNPETGRVEVIDTANGFFTNRDFGLNANFSTVLYGLWRYRGFLQALRHKMTPTIGFTYRPDFSDEGWGFYERIFNDSTGQTEVVNPYQGFIYGAPGNQRQGSLNFGVQNTLEGKVRSQKDTSGLKKISILERFSFNTSYNMAAREFQWSQPTLNVSSSILDRLIRFNYNATFDLYGFDEELGQRVNQFAWDVNRTLLRTTNQRIAFNLNLNARRFAGNKEDAGQASNNPAPQAGGNESEDAGEVPGMGITEGDIDYYRLRKPIDFNIPWSLDLQYSLTRSSPGGREPAISQSLGFSGDIDLSQGWKIGFRSGYDFEARDFTVTSFDFYRDLHCWELSCSWTPIGFNPTYLITIRVKADMLSDLKLERRRGVGDFQP